MRSVSAVRPSSVTDSLRGRYHTISGYDALLSKKLLGLTITKFYCGIDKSFTLHLLMMNFYYVDEKKIISNHMDVKKRQVFRMMVIVLGETF